jgi:hypothetical protein
MLCLFFGWLVFFGGLGFELRALHLQSKGTLLHEPHVQIHFALLILEMEPLKQFAPAVLEP